MINKFLFFFIVCVISKLTDVEIDRFYSNRDKPLTMEDSPFAIYDNYDMKIQKLSDQVKNLQAQIQALKTKEEPKKVPLKTIKHLIFYKSKTTNDSNQLQLNCINCDDNSLVYEPELIKCFNDESWNCDLGDIPFKYELKDIKVSCSILSDGYIEPFIIPETCYLSYSLHLREKGKE